MNNKLKIIIPVGIALIAIALAFVFIRFTPEETADFSAVISTAQQYLIDQKYEQAIVEFEKAIQIDPRNVDAYIGIAQAYEAIGDTESALEWLQKGYDLTGDTSLKNEIDRLSVRSAEAETTTTTTVTTTTPTTVDEIDCVTIENYQIPTNIVTLTLVGPDGDENIYNSNTYKLESPLIDMSIISKFTNLLYLYIDSCQISDISALSSLTNLKDLLLYNNQINDINALRNLTNLENLALSNCQISDISALSNLTDLKRLNLQFNQISDISALSGLINLEELHLYENQISDINALSNLINLKELDLDFNQINDISALSNLTNLEILHMYRNPISKSDIKELKKALPNCVILH